jgi:hypothetical protein
MDARPDASHDLISDPKLVKDIEDGLTTLPSSSTVPIATRHGAR